MRLHRLCIAFAAIWLLLGVSLAAHAAPQVCGYTWVWQNGVWWKIPLWCPPPISGVCGGCHE